MSIWSAEIKELKQVYLQIKGKFLNLEKELEKLIAADDENMLLVYSRRCLARIIHHFNRIMSIHPTLSGNYAE